MSADGVRELTALIEDLPLVDHHVHGATRRQLDRAALEGMLAQSRFKIIPYRKFNVARLIRG